MKRRSLLQKSLILGTAGLIGGGTVWLLNGKNPTELTIQQTMQTLENLDLNQLQSATAWAPGQVFQHLAQSIEYSMLGYPEHKSDLFKNTVGQLAFKVFSTRGMMSHNLTEAIPGAPALTNADLISAHQRLLGALQQFERFKGELKPHFAYGELNHEEYSLAHVMHIHDHFSAIQSG